MKKYKILVGSDCVAILVNGSLDFGCSKQHGVDIFVFEMKKLQSMGYTLEQIVVDPTYSLYS